MAIPVIMPKQGQSVETCIITRWLKKKGEAVKTGDLLFSYETDKAAFDAESPADGILIDMFFREGDEVPVLVNVAVIGAAGESAETFRSGGKTETAGKSSSGAAVERAEPAAQPDVHAVSADQGARIRVSPRARKLAREKNIDLQQLRGSGPNGRIVVRDVEIAGSAGFKAQEPLILQQGADFSDQPVTNVRKLIARAMHDSLQNTAQLTHHMSADARRILDARKKVKAEQSRDASTPDITLNDMVCWCVIRALEVMPGINVHFLDDRIRKFSRVHLGLAVDTPRGLMVPVLRNASDYNLAALSRELRGLADACRKGSISPELIRSDAASFTVSNLGNYGVEMFTPVLNVPQAGILGVCAITHRPADLGNGVFGFVPYIGLSLTYDHRAIDGGPATLFLREIRNQIEQFSGTW